MAQLAIMPTVDRARYRHHARGNSRPVEAPSIRIHIPVEEEQRKQWRYRALTIQDTQPIACPMIRLQPIVKKPLQPYLLRESACDFLECRSSGRRCIVSERQEVTLEYQVSYCLGSRHRSCPMYADATNGKTSGRFRKLMYAAAIVALVVLAAAVAAQTFGASAPVEVGRAVGLG
ncbi:MAG: hypothetical protein R3A46_19870 [Thermomicrobiales bacterium]